MNLENLKSTWIDSKSPSGKISPSGDLEYINLWEEHFSNFGGRILEIGAGNGFLAKNILERNKDVQYTILDIAAHFDEIRETLRDHSTVEYIASSDYKKIFDQEWDLLIETHCLSETPRHYYTDILENISVKSCFVIDYGGDPNDPGFDKTLNDWFDRTFAAREKYPNNKLLGGHKRDIPVYIGKPKTNTMFNNPFAEYHNRHLGAKGILFGSGPSILKFKGERTSDDVLRFGVNDQIFLDLELDYWFMGDAMPQVPSKFYDKFDEYNNYMPKKQKFVRYCNWKDDREITVPNWGKVPRNGQLPLDMKNCKYYICDSGGNPESCLFKKDISVGNMTAVASISFEILQFMLYCGVKEIFLVGHDCDYSNGTFAKIMIGKQQNADYYILRYWSIVKEWIEENYPDVKVYSVNPVALHIFPTIQQKNIG